MNPNPTPAAAAPGRFDYVAYDARAQEQQASFKELFTILAGAVERNLKPGRYPAIVQTKLEEAYAFIGKAIRDEQIMRNGAAPVNEARGPG